MRPLFRPLSHRTVSGAVLALGLLAPTGASHAQVAQPVAFGAAAPGRVLPPVLSPMLPVLPMHGTAAPAPPNAPPQAFATPLAPVAPAGSMLARDTVMHTKRPIPLFTLADAALIGGFAATAMLVAPLDRSFAERLQRPLVQENQFFGDVAAVVRDVATPGSVIIGVGLYTFGRLTKNQRAADLGLHGTEALFFGEAVAVVMKGIFGRQRPFVDISNPNNYQLGRGFRGKTDYRSFPSGHTTAAFAAAAAVTAETHQWWPKSTWIIGPALYGGATLAGLSRMYNNRHWATDVVAGAAIGTIAGLKVVRWHHSRPNNRIDRALLGASMTQAPSGQPMLQLMVRPSAAP